MMMIGHQKNPKLCPIKMVTAMMMMETLVTKVTITVISKSLSIKLKGAFVLSY